MILALKDEPNWKQREATYDSSPIYFIAHFMDEMRAQKTAHPFFFQAPILTWLEKGLYSISLFPSGCSSVASDGN